MSKTNNNPDNIRFADKTSDIRNLSENITYDAAAYLGFLAPWENVNFGFPNQSVRGSIDAKSELKVKGTSEADSGPAYTVFIRL